MGVAAARHQPVTRGLLLWVRQRAPVCAVGGGAQHPRCSAGLPSFLPDLEVCQRCVDDVCGGVLTEFFVPCMLERVLPCTGWRRFVL